MSTESKPKKKLVYKKNDYVVENSTTAENKTINSSPQELASETKTNATTIPVSDTLQKEENKIEVKDEKKEKKLKKPLNSSKAEFVPQSYQQEYPEFENDSEDELENELGEEFMRLDIDNVNHFHEPSKNCECCKGYINKCKGQMCEMLDCCYCFATQEEENMYNKKQSKF